MRVRYSDFMPRLMFMILGVAISCTLAVAQEDFWERVRRPDKQTTKPNANEVAAKVTPSQRESIANFLRRRKLPGRATLKTNPKMPG